jgi:tRNA A-37 threonylcarbamoyl transferase component Bud32/DNA-binding NarL/FixJ family response regulator
MSIKVMIIDGHAEFRALLMHHVTTHWNDAIITAYDPVSAGNLPDEFSGAGNDIILLGDDQGDRDGLKTLKQFLANSAFPAIVYFGSGDTDEEAAVTRIGAEGYLRREKVRHDVFAELLGEILRRRQRVASTISLFAGNAWTGMHPLIKGYRLIRKLSTSEHSVVYLAMKDSAELQIVLKVLRQDPELPDSIDTYERFLQEYEMIADLEHPNIVKIHDLGVADDHAHIVMEYLSGGDLKRHMERPISPAQAVSFVKQIAGALAKIHSVGILHRDLKPGNIMLREDGSIALIDFGLAQRMRVDEETAPYGEIFGTPYYMSPEQGHAREMDERSDIYSLGIIFYEMLTGDKPFRADNAMGIIYKHTNAPVPTLPVQHAQYQAVINLMLAKNPENRIQAASEIAKWF